MLTRTPFYNETIRRATVVFGTLFNNISIVNKKDDGTIVKQTKVPLAFTQKRKFLDRIRQEPSFSEGDKQQVAISLPRMSFDLIGMDYHSEIQTSIYQRQLHSANFDGSKNTTYSGIPYKLSFELNVYCDKHDEALQIIEQIIPYFRPDFMVSVKESMNSEIVWDMPITLESVSPQTEYQGQQEDRRVIVYTLTFSSIVRFYGAIPEPNDGSSEDSRKVITKVICSLNTSMEQKNNPFEETVTVEAIESSPGGTTFPGYVIQTTYISDLFPDD